MYGQATLDITGQQICCNILLFLFKQSQVAIDIEQPLVPCVFICPPRSCQSGPKRVGGSRWVVTEARCGGSMLAMRLPPPWSYKQFVTQENHAIILSIYPKRYFEYESNRWACGGGRGDWMVEMEVRVWQGTTLVWSYNHPIISPLSITSQYYLQLILLTASQWCEINKERHLLEPRPVQVETLLELY